MIAVLPWVMLAAKNAHALDDRAAIAGVVVGLAVAVGAVAFAVVLVVLKRTMQVAFRLALIGLVLGALVLSVGMFALLLAM